MRAFLPGSYLVCFFLTVAACTAKPPPKTNNNECDCSARVCGLLCGKVCGTCENDGICATDGLSCQPARDIGAACTTDIECGLNRMCLDNGGGFQAPNGYCSKACSTSVPCPTGASCGIDSKGDSVCLAQCTPGDGGTSGCREADGYRCSAAHVCPACVPDCTGFTCGDDGCGGSCGMPNPMTPACLAPGEICSGHGCASAYIRNSLPSNAFPNGLFDSIALERNGQAVIIGGREVAYYTGGFPASTRGVSEIEVYDPMTSALAASVHYTALPKRIARPHAAFFNGTLYVAGGIADPDVPEGQPNSVDGIVSDFYQYGTNANWVTKAAIPEPSIGGGLAAASDALYLVVGQTADGNVSQTFHAYDPAADEWDNPIPPPDRPTARSFAGVVTDGNRIYVVGGYDGANPVATVEIFDPARGWSTGTPLPFPVVDPKVAVASGRIFVFGGRFSPALKDDVVPYVQTIDLKTRATHVLGQTYAGLTGQTPVGLRTAFLLFGGMQLDLGSGSFLPNKDVVTFTVPAP